MFIGVADIYHLKMKKILPAVFAVLFFASCSKNNDPLPDFNEKVKAPLIIEFDNVAGDKNLQLNTGVYTNAAGEQFSVSNLKYFISNIKLTSSDGHEYVVPQDSSYFLIDEANEASHEVHLNIPVAEYNKLTFTVGVDSLRSTMDVSKRTGVLDPSGSMEDGMYWGWNSGYIFLKLEGISPAAPVDATGQRKFRFHIGGFGGYSAPTINNIKTVSLDLSKAGVARVQQGRESQVHLFADIMKVLNGSTNVSIAANPQVMFSDYSVKVANNYAAMFSHNHTHN